MNNDMDDVKIRNFSAEIRKKNEETRTVTFIASDESRDSAHTILLQDGWDLSRFEKNPIIGYNHQIYGSWKPEDVDFVIGKGKAYVEDKQLLVDITFEPASINELAEKVYQKVLFGSINSVSVGFIPIKGHWSDKEGEGPREKNETYFYNQMQLLEISVVNIPANGNANKKGEGEVEDELKELRALVPETKKTAEEVDEVANANRVKLLKAAASAALMLNQ
jgi:HK97 family phage prohead protease